MTKNFFDKDGFTKTVPIAAGYLFLGFAYGLVMRNEGFPSWVPILMSLLVYSGSLQFAALPFLSQALHPLNFFIFSFLIGARHIFYSLSLIRSLQAMGWHRFPSVFAITDETYSIIVGDKDKHEDEGLFYATITMAGFIYWNVGTIIGIVAGNFLPFKLEGLDFTLTALFLVLFLEQIKTKEGRKNGFLGLSFALISLFFVGEQNMVIATMFLILVTFFITQRGGKKA